MADPRDRVEHSLALKVMRLTRPTLGVYPAPLPCSDTIAADLFAADLSKDLNSLERMEELVLGQLLILPQSFGNIYLGETFCSYICVHNDSTEQARSILVKADLQTGTQRIGLVAGQDVAGLAPGETIDHVILHEVKELGTHILVCDVTYSNPAAEKLNFRKFFKFQVMKPLDVKTKFYNAESDEVFLEAQVQNITLGTINLDRVSLEPSTGFTLRALSVQPEPSVCGGGSGGGILISGTSLQSQDAWQYLFCLSPRADLLSDRSINSITNIGKLDIVWRTAFCEKGRLQTSQLQRQPPSVGELNLTLLSAPALALVHRPVALTLRITNSSDRTVELDLCLNTDPGGVVYWVGVTSTNLGLLEPGGSLEVGVEVVLQDTGLHYLTGLRLQDNLLNRLYEFNDLIQMFVVKEKDLFNFLKEEIRK